VVRVCRGAVRDDKGALLLVPEDVFFLSEGCHILRRNRGSEGGHFRVLQRGHVYLNVGAWSGQCVPRIFSRCTGDEGPWLFDKAFKAIFSQDKTTIKDPDMGCYASGRQTL